MAGVDSHADAPRSNRRSRTSVGSTGFANCAIGDHRLPLRIELDSGRLLRSRFLLRTLWISHFDVTPTRVGSIGDDRPTALLGSPSQAFAAGAFPTCRSDRRRDGDDAERLQQAAHVRECALDRVYASNWYQIHAGVPYFSLSSQPSPWVHTWSLAIEEQFYLLWPIVLLVVLASGPDREAPLRHGGIESGSLSSDRRC